MKSPTAHKTKSEVDELMQITQKPNIGFGNSIIPLDIKNLEYIFEMLTELRNIAKNTGEESLVYYLEMAALDAGELCDSLKFQLDAGSDD